MKQLKPYPKYKETGNEWLGDIPEQWELIRLTKGLSSIIDYRGKTPTKTDDGIFLITTTNIRYGKIDYEKSQEYVNPEEYDSIMGRGKPQIGDILFTMEAPLGEVAAVDNTLVALAQRIIKMRTMQNMLNPYFVKYFLLSSAFQHHLVTFATGSTALGIKASKLNELIALRPYLQEQQNIVEFLDKDTSRIDTLIAKKQSQIELLEEKRAALITQAVTKGLDPQAKMKDSGIEWLGMIPEHWELVRMDWVMENVKENVKIKDIDSDEVLYYSIPNVQDTGDAQIESLENISSDKILLSGNELLISKLNPRKGVVIITRRSELPIVSSTEFVPLKANGIKLEYAYYLYISSFIRERISSNVHSATKSHQRAGTDDVIKIKNYIPPEDEQRKISVFLDKCLLNIDSSLTKLQGSIELLNEYLSSLITSAVTGKIDLRD